MWYVYVLLCQDGSLYTGCTNDVEKRFAAHLAGKGGHYTRSRRPIKVMFQEEVADRSTALKRELEIKGWSRQQKINRLKLAI
ncbi:MAG TPA: GIY-YIG nuclease family protein [Patescibacteria group bacterium]